MDTTGICISNHSVMLGHVHLIFRFMDSQKHLIEEGMAIWLRVTIRGDAALKLFLSVTIFNRCYLWLSSWTKAVFLILVLGHTLGGPSHLNHSCDPSPNRRCIHVHFVLHFLAIPSMKAPTSTRM